MFRAVWIEIPVNDLEWAMAFYQAVFDLPAAEIADDGERRTATLLNGGAEGQTPGISLNQTANFTPSDKGVYVYFDCGSESTSYLPKVEAAGGKVIQPETSMGGAGYFASVLDTEGNMIGLYSYR